MFQKHFRKIHYFLIKYIKSGVAIAKTEGCFITETMSKNAFYIIFKIIYEHISAIKPVYLHQLIPIWVLICN